MPNKEPGSRITSLTDLVARMQQAGKAAFDVFNGRPFGPNVPLEPRLSEQDKTEGPRLNEYRTAANLVIRPRQEYSDLNPFDQIRNLCRLYDVANICIDKQIKQLCSLDWTISAIDKKEQQGFEDSGLLKTVTDWWKYPDRDSMFSDWLASLLRNVLEIDALALYPMRNRLGQLRGLEVIDGSTIKPLIDDRGRVLAYQQIIHGLPAGNYVKYGVDTFDEILPIEFPGYEGNSFPQELIYRPRNPRPDLPYGIAPAEFVILRMNAAIRKQQYDLAYFTDGNIPDMIINPPDGLMNVDQVAQFEEWFNAVLEGNDSQRRKARFLAWNANVQQLKTFSYDTALDDFMMKVTCSAFNVTPAEMGFTDDVNRATGESQEDVQYRTGIRPLARWLKELFDRIIQEPRGMGLPGLEWQWKFGEATDNLKNSQEFAIYLDRGVVSPDEVRQLRFNGELEGASPGGNGLAPTASAKQTSPASSGDTDSDNTDAQNQDDTAKNKGASDLFELLATGTSESARKNVEWAKQVVDRQNEYNKAQGLKR